MVNLYVFLIRMHTSWARFEPTVCMTLLSHCPPGSIGEKNFPCKLTSDESGSGKPPVGQELFVKKRCIVISLVKESKEKRTFQVHSCLSISPLDLINEHQTFVISNNLGQLNHRLLTADEQEFHDREIRRKMLAVAANFDESQHLRTADKWLYSGAEWTQWENNFVGKQ